MLQNTELLRVTVEDLDGEPETPAEAPVNILREKTFNPELSSLLNKIYSHEKTAETETPSPVKIEPVLKLTMLQRCDELIYKLKHKADEASLTSDFNPFSLDIDVYDDIDDLNDYIETGMKQSGFSRFLILKYSFIDSAFRTDLNRISETLTADLFFSTKDPLFISMYENNTGYMLNSALINRDLFMKKKLETVFRPDDNKRVIYFVRLCSICDYDKGNPVIKNSMSSFEQYLSPILAVIPEVENEYYNENEIFETLKRNMEIPFSLYIMKNRLNFYSSAFSYEEALLMLELVMNSPAVKGMTRSILTLDNFSVKENMFIMKLLLSRIRKRLEMDSFFMRIGMNKCILITSENEKKDIALMIDEINVSEKIISIESIDAGSGYNGDSYTRLFL